MRQTVDWSEWALQFHNYYKQINFNMRGEKKRMFQHLCLLWLCDHLFVCAPSDVQHNSNLIVLCSTWRKMKKEKNTHFRNKTVQKVAVSSGKRLNCFGVAISNWWFICNSSWQIETVPFYIVYCVNQMTSMSSSTSSSELSSD